MKKVGIVIDLQNDFITGVLGNEACQKACEEAAKVLKEYAFDFVYVTKDTHDEDYLNTQEGKKLPVPHCIVGSDGWQLAEKISRALEENYEKDNVRVVTKNTFGSVELGKLVKEYAEKEGETEIYIFGVCTGICVISNAMILKACLPEAKLNIIEKACACVTEESHRNALEAMKMTQMDIIEKTEK